MDSPTETPMREEDIMSVINQLAELKTSKPDVFKQLLQSLGLGEDADLFANGEEGIRRMTESIAKMRSESKDGSIDSNIFLSKDGKQQPKGITITPIAGLTIKTLLVSESSNTTGKSESEKVFINLTQHDEIAKPGMKKKLNDEGEEVEGMNIPMSVGPLHFEEDNKGASCRVYDIIVNGDVINETASDVTGKYRDFICQLAIQCVEQKHKLVLDKRYKLPKLKYCGKVILSQYIQDRKNMPSIVDVTPESSSSSKKVNSKAKGKAAAVGVTSSRVVELSDSDLTYRISWLQPRDDVTESAVLTLDSLSTHYDHIACTNHIVNEYLDPIQPIPGANVVGLLITIEMNASQALLIQSCTASESAQLVQISPFRVLVKLPQFKKSTLYLPHSILPNAAQAHLAYPSDGYITKMELQLILPLDLSDCTSSVDAGSKAWLMSQALSQEDSYQSNSSNPYSSAVENTSIGKGSTAGDTLDKSKEGEFPEDRFHIKLPDDVDKYTGVKVQQNDPNALIEAMDGKVNLKSTPQGGDDEEEELLPEDRFHSKDASSSYLINQREQAKKDKWEKYEREKAERKDDPNVEYVEMDDFRAGGKYGEDKSKEGRDLAALSMAENTSSTPENEALKKASSILTSSQNLPLEGMLSSTLWSELLE